jgi:hypothetical protein
VYLQTDYNNLAESGQGEISNERIEKSINCKGAIYVIFIGVCLILGWRSQPNPQCNIRKTQSAAIYNIGARKPAEDGSIYRRPEWVRVKLTLNVYKTQ